MDFPKITLAGQLQIARLEFFVTIDGKQKKLEQLLPIPGETGKYSAAAGDNAVATVEEYAAQDCFQLQMTLKNTEKTAIRFGGFQLRVLPDAKSKDFLSSAPGKEFRVYREGWAMPSPCGCVHYGECDFEGSEAYLPYSVCAPKEYSSKTPNVFSAEYVTVLNCQCSKRNLLLGFTTSRHAFGRFRVELDENGVKCVTAINDFENIRLDSGEVAESERLTVLANTGDGYSLLRNFAAIWGREMNAVTWDHTPKGWCSWYYYFHRVTENDVCENIRFIAAHREEFPLEYIQLDDGYQHALGDWLVCNEKFPHGIEFLVRETEKNGFQFGLWLAPFMVEERSELFKSHPEWMVHDHSGQVLWGLGWRENSRCAILDGTHPGALEYLKKVFSQLRKWGVVYVKLDFLVQACALGENGVYFDVKATRNDALRRGLGAIREVFEDKFILGCTVPLGSAVGLVNGERIGTDITPRWRKPEYIHREAPTVPNVCRNLINRCYMHRNLWISDPDTHIARSDNNDLTLPEIELWTNALYLCGGMMLLSDRFETLAPERAKYSKLLLAETDRFETRPLDMFADEYPKIWLARRHSNGEICIGLFNFEDKEQEIKVDLNLVEPHRTFEISGHFDHHSFGRFQDEFRRTLAPHSSMLFSLK